MRNWLQPSGEEFFRQHSLHMFFSLQESGWSVKALPWLLDGARRHLVADEWQQPLPSCRGGPGDWPCFPQFVHLHESVSSQAGLEIARVI